MSRTLARVLSLLVFALAARWYVAPWLNSRSRGGALVVLLWVHAFRHVALHLGTVPADGTGLPSTDPRIARVMYGDVTAMLLALIAIGALRYRWRPALALVWVFVAESVADIGSIIFSLSRGRLPVYIDGANWLVRSFFIPLMLVTLVLIVWQLISRRGEPLERVEDVEKESRSLHDCELIDALSGQGVR